MPFKYYPISYQVYDADTIHVVLDLGFDAHLKMSARVQGIDAPELRTRQALQKKASYLVRDVVVQWCQRQNRLVFESLAKDKFAGRFIARVYGTKMHLAQYLLMNKLVRAYDGGKKEKWSEKQLKEIIERCHGILPVTDPI